MKKLFTLFVFLCATISLIGQDKNTTHFKGFFNYEIENETDKVLLEVTELEKEFLYVYALSSGIGSNDIGLDRGQLGKGQVVYFKKAGQKLLLVEPNLKYRALTDNVLEKTSVEQAFAKSILASFPIMLDDKGAYTIDITDFLKRDAHGVAAKLKSKDQGSYSLEADKSVLNLDRTKAFPKNIEFDVMLTFKGNATGKWIRSVAPSPNMVTVTQHHSFIELPDANYKKRVFDPRSGANAFSYYDYATPVHEPILKRYITRHRLEKKNPNAAVSEAKEPIIYYLDNGTPEPVRSALLDGGRWWNEAFEAAGYKNAFQLKMLPDDADPLDSRYNVIQWVHRSTRGWSYGSSIKDPRTGEIIKGHVSLGSLRIRQDFLIAQALLNKPFSERDDNYQPMLEMALARIRQLSAHEIGHTLGFAHNYAASTNENASVMDYPHPQFKRNGNNIEIDKTYSTGIGDWDKVSVAYAYTEFKNDTDEKKGLQSILKQAQEKGLRFITDQDARPHGSSHALAHLWDNGENVTTELTDMLAIRKQAIENFSIDNIKTGEPNTVLEDVFVPLYFFHRYQTEAVTKVIGGQDYNYAVKGDGQLTVKTIDKIKQEKALKAVLRTLQAEEIAIPADKLSLFPPRAFGYSKTRESLKGKMSVSFDALSAAETAADMSLGFLLNPERASRLIQQKALLPDNLGLQEVLNDVVDATIKHQIKNEYYKTVQENINFKVIEHIMNLAVHTKVHPQVNAIAFDALNKLQTSFMKNQSIINSEMARRIEKFSAAPEDFKVIATPQIPDGSPIGMDCY